MRIVGLDVGERRIGLAISDASATLARPVSTVERAGPVARAAEEIATRIRQQAVEHDEPIALIVVGLPAHLDGNPSEQTSRVQAFAAVLGRQLPIPIVFQDERLSSHEAESRLAIRERNWRRRKAKLDAAAAAVILQDYLDQQ